MRIDNRGFSLIEILIAIGILAIIMAMNSQLLQDFIRMQTQQNVIVSNQFETTIGLEMLRNDVSSAGFGLADSFRSPPGMYTEAPNAPALQFNSAPNPPLPLNHSNDVSGSAGYAANSDYLVIRSPAVGMSQTAGKWTNIVTTDFHKWNDPNLDMVDGQDYVIVVKPRTALGNTPGAMSELIVSGGTYALVYNSTAAVNAAFQPDATKDEKFLAFGLGTVAEGLPIRPFNRADYYIRLNSADPVPNPNCAPGTGTLIKEVLNQKDTAAVRHSLIQCAASMQVIFRLDTNADGVPDQSVNTLAGLNSMDIKQQVVEVQIYLLVHDGVMDGRFRWPNQVVTVGPQAGAPGAGLGADIDLRTLLGNDNWPFYRWKIHTLLIKPKSFY